MQVTLRDDFSAVPPHGVLVLRPLNRKDRAAWSRLRNINSEWLGRWEARDPHLSLSDTRTFSFRTYLRGLNRQSRLGEMLAFAIEFDGELAGQLTVSGIVYGSQRSCVVGYWVSKHMAGRGIAPAAVAMALDHCLDTMPLHRVEICIRPENSASLRVVEKLHLREEGLREKYIFVAGRWRDHRVFAVTREDVVGPGGMLARWHQITSL